MDTIAEAVAIDNRFTQKMGGCQGLNNALQGSDAIVRPCLPPWGRRRGSEPKGEIR